MPVRLPFIIFGSLFFCVSLRAATTERGASYWNELDGEEPFCRGRVDLDVGRDYFVEIANELPGVGEYNALVQAYRRRDTETLERRAKVFRQVYEGSPLGEPLRYLLAESRFDRATDENSAREAEKVWRETMLLHPRSTLRPVVSATAAAFFLKRGAFQKGLAVYEATLAEGADPRLACTLLMGIAESHFLLGDLKTARERYAQVVKGCENPRVLSGALIRMADTRATEGAAAVTVYDGPVEEYASLVNRFYPFALYNAGEMKYRARKLTEARFYFNEFLKHESRQGECRPRALKRLADIALLNGAKAEEVAGLYLLVRDAVPAEDTGRYAYARALLVTLPSMDNADYGRRLRLIDENLGAIRDDGLRTKGFLEKGLVLLTRGEPQALDYLLRLRHKAPVLLGKGSIGALLRDEILARLANAAVAGGMDLALERLELWREAELWQDARPSMAVALITALYAPLAPEAVPPALAYLRREELVNAVVFPEFALLWAAVAVRLGDEQRLKETFPSRRWETLVEAFPAGGRSAARLAAGEALLRLGRYSDAEKVMLKVKDPALFVVSLGALFTLYREEGRHGKAFEVGTRLVKALGPKERGEKLAALSLEVLDGKLWSKAEELLDLCRMSGVSGPALAPFHALAGRADFERTRCKSSIAQYQLALGMGLDPLQGAEAKFRLGRCLLKEKQGDEARQVWQELVAMKDDFWSQLAQNEIKVMFP